MMLKIDHMSFSYGEHQVLKDVSFEVERGTFLSVLGPNGVGKTTLFRCIMGAQKCYTGGIYVEGEDIRQMSRSELAGKVGYIPQIHRPTFGYTVLDTVLMGLTGQMNFFSVPKPAHVERAMAALSRMGMADYSDRLYSKMSGGEQQLVLIARAIAQNADILIMDEPTSALDFGNQYRVLEQVKQLSEEGYTILLSTHNPQHALSFSDHILALFGGKVAAYGNTKETLTETLIETLYRMHAEFLDTEHGSVILPLTGGRT